MAFHCGCTVLFRVIDSGTQQLRGDTERAMLAIDREAGDPPNGGDIIEYAPKRAVTGNTGDVASGHDSGPSHRDVVDIGHDAKWHQRRRDLLV